MSVVIGPEDYAEPRCLLCGDPFGAEPGFRAIPQERVVEKLNEYMSRRDYAGAERHLNYWLEEATLGRDENGELLLCNELVGHYRKTGEKEKAFQNAQRALDLVRELNYGDSVSGATTWVNAATAYSAFGEQETALALFRKARAVYEARPETRPGLLGGLYNNMALCYTALGRYEEAFALFEKAMDVMGRVPAGALEQAVTCLNMADAVAAQQGLERGEGRITELLDRAETLLHDPAVPHDGYYAFVCEKCAPGFAHYGWFAASQELKKAAEEIYERT